MTLNDTNMTRDALPWIEYALLLVSKMLPTK